MGGTEVHYLHPDLLGSIRSITDAFGVLVETRFYAPFGEITGTSGGATPTETIGFIGERYDSDAGLQYLNARYYDPRLGLFIQPDWFEVTEPGVGTNRYSYSFNDPINLRDPLGNIADEAAATLSENAYRDDDEEEELPSEIERLGEEELRGMGIDPTLFEETRGFSARA